MLDLQDLLRRFRPLIMPPGLAAPASVPVDREAAMAAELRDVLGAIDAVEEEAAQLEQTARDQAEARREAAAKETHALAAGGPARAEEARRRAFDRRREVRLRELRVQHAAATRKASAIRRRATARTGDLTAAVLHCVLEGDLEDGRPGG
jgi:rubrerythrin